MTALWGFASLFAAGRIALRGEFPYLHADQCAILNRSMDDRTEPVARRVPAQQRAWDTISLTTPQLVCSVTAHHGYVQ